MTINTIGDQIKLRRVALNLSQRELARNIELSHTYISYLESGQREPTPENLAALNRGLATRLDSPELQLAAAILTGRCRHFNQIETSNIINLLACACS